jgi:hypothetical protein
MIFNMSSGGAGGAAGLNFKVVDGTTKPTNPKENMIWVNTATKITSWVFSAIEPNNPVDDMVWFSIGTTSASEFNALKKNGIMVYPLSAKQYISGAWVTVTAMSYMDGQWDSWILYLYNKGIEYIDEYGNGWTGSGDHYTKESGYLLLGKTETAPGHSSAWTSGFFDTTNLTTVEVYVDEYHRGGPESFGKIEVLDASGSVVAATSFSVSQNEVWTSLDVSSIASSCRVMVSSGHTRTSGQTAYMKFSIVRCYQ